MLCRALAVLALLATLLLAGCAQPQQDLETEAYLLSAINELRAEQQCAPLTQDPALRRKAQGLMAVFENRGSSALSYPSYTQALDQRARRIGLAMGEVQGTLYWMAVVGVDT